MTESTDPTIKPTTPEAVTTTPPIPSTRPEPKKPEISVSTEPYAVVGTGETDTVKKSAIKFKNKFAKKSLSVHHLQRRLNELGFSDAYADLDGYFGDLTRNAVLAFQKKSHLDETGDLNDETLTALFDGDPNVTLDLN